MLHKYGQVCIMKTANFSSLPEVCVNACCSVLCTHTSPPSPQGHGSIRIPTRQVRLSGSTGRAPCCGFRGSSNLSNENPVWIHRWFICGLDVRKAAFYLLLELKALNKRIHCLVWNAGPDSDVIKVSALRRQKDDEIRRLIASKSIFGNC